MPGTRVVGKGTGATPQQLTDAVLNYLHMKECVKALGNVGASGTHGLKAGPLWWTSHQTNVALTGEPLDASDLARIAECE